MEGLIRDIEPDTIDVLNENPDGSSKDWYVESAQFKDDVMNHDQDYHIEVEHSPDYGSYYDNAVKAMKKEKLSPLEVPTEDQY